jgi:hypothetical protein
MRQQALALSVQFNLAAIFHVQPPSPHKLSELRRNLAIDGNEN